MTRMTAWVVAAVLLSAPALKADDLQRAMLPVSINETAQGDVLAILAGDDVLLPKSFLDAAGVSVPEASTRPMDGESYVSLKALAPQSTFKLNPDDLTLSITLDPRLLGHKNLQLKRGDAGAADRGGDPTLYLNYALSGDRSTAPNVFGELGASRGNTLLYTGFSRSGDALRRGLTYANYDWPTALRRLTAGDAVVGSDPLGGSVTIGGVTVRREFTLQPYLVRSRPFDVTGTALTPSTVEVYVNGQLTNRISVEPGVFTLRDLPVTGGLGNTQLVVRDVYGRETVEQQSFYYSTSALRKGLSDYVFSAGALRTDLGDTTSYKHAAALAQYRVGLTNVVTLGARGEASDKLVSGGPRATFGTSFGDIDLEVAGSSADGRTGTAGLAAYRFNAQRFSFGFAGTKRSDEYATLSVAPEMDKVTRDATVFFSAYIARLSVGLQASVNDTRDGDRRRRLALQATTPLWRYGSLFSSFGTVERNGKRSPEILVGLTVSVGNLTTANAVFSKDDSGSGTQVELRKPLSQANGYGFSLQHDSRSELQHATLEYQTSFGRYSLNVDPRRASEATYTASGGLVYLGGALLPSRAVQEGFALARVGVPGVKIFASNQEVGRTNRHGDLLVANLLPHYANELRLQDKDLPIDYEVENAEVTVVPPSRGGILARFPVRKIRSYTGKAVFVIIGQPYTPAFGLLEVSRPGAEPLELGLGRAGEFYVDDLEPGTYDARLRIGKVGCNVKLILPKSDNPVTDVGVIRCAP